MRKPSYYPVRKILYGKPDRERMCGVGRIERQQRSPEPPFMRAKHVEFTDGGCTKWHYHCGDQLLLVTKGKGFVEFRGHKTVKIKTGDRVIIPSGVSHRHGALGKKMVHLAVTTGETHWEKDDPK